MNRIEIYPSGWHGRKVLVANWKIGKENQIVIKDPNFPEPFYATGKQLTQWPLQMITAKSGNRVPMRVVPLDNLTTDLVLEEL